MFLPDSKSMKDALDRRARSKYHYTSISSLMKIIQSKRLWMTNVHYLNDWRELHEGLDSIRKSINSENSFITFPADSLSEERKPSAIDRLRTIYGQDSVIFSDPIFSFSLSADGDCLSQWARYGDYAIEFSPTEINPALLLEDCVYVHEEQDARANSEICDAIRRIVSNRLNFHSGRERVSFDDCVGPYIYAATFKHEGFKEEKETRLLYTAARHKIEGVQIDYREGTDRIKPYVSMPFEKTSIKSITIGPIVDQDGARRSLQDFLDWEFDRIGPGIPYDTNTQRTVRTKISNIPYRGF